MSNRNNIEQKESAIEYFAHGRAQMRPGKAKRGEGSEDNRKRYG